MLRVVPDTPEIVVGVPGGVAHGTAKGAWDGALPQVAEKKSCWRLSRPQLALACSLLAGLLATLLFFVITAATVRNSVPSLHPVRVALDVSSDVTSLTASIDAELTDSGRHSVRMRGGVCSVDTPCAGGARCTMLVAEIDDPFYAEDTRVQFVARATQSWPQNIRLAFRNRGQGLGVSCNLQVTVDLYKTGIVVEQESSWRFEDVGAASGLMDGSERPLLTIRRDGWTPRPGANSSIDGNFVAELALPAGPLVEMLEAVSVGVKANAGYIESGNRALEGRFSVNADVHVARNASTGYAVVSLPFSLFARADVPSVAGYMPMSAARAERVGERGSMHLFLKDHSLVFEAAPDSQAAAGIFGQVHVVGWRRDWKERSRRGSSGGGGRALAASGDHVPTGARRLLGLFGIEDFLGFELQSLDTHHRFYFDDDAFLGLDFKMMEGPPFAIGLGVKVKSTIADDIFGEKSEFVFNVTFMVHDGDETAKLEVSLESLSEGKSNTMLDFNTALDIKGETLDVQANLTSEDIDIVVQTGVHFKDALVFVKANISDMINASISGDFDDLVFQASMTVKDVLDVSFTGIEDKVDLDAVIDSGIMGDDKSMTAAIDYRRVDVSEDVENFTASLTLQERNGHDYSEAHVKDWTKPSSETKAAITAKSESSMTLSLDHGRRRTAAAGGTRELSAYMSMLPECEAAGDGAPSESAVVCCDAEGNNCESCCKDGLQSMMVDMMGGSMGSSLGTEGLDILLTDLAGAEGDMSFVAAWDLDDLSTPRVAGELRVVDGVSTLDFVLNETSKETLFMGTAEWQDVTGGHSASVSVSDGEGSLQLKALGKWSETTDAAGLITRSGAGSVRNGSDVLMGGGSGTWTESSDGAAHTLLVNLYNESNGQVINVDAHLDDTGAGAKVDMEAKEFLDGEVYFKELTSGNMDARAHAKIEGEELVSLVGDWDNAEGWGGDLKVTVKIEKETIVVDAGLSEDSDVRSVVCDATQNSAYLFGAAAHLSDGGLSSEAPAFVNVSVLEGADKLGLLSVYGRITNPDYALDADASRVIKMKNPIEAYGYLDARDDDSGSLERMALVSMNVTEAEVGNGSVVTAAVVVSDSKAKEMLALGADFDTSDSTQMEVSASLHVEGDSMLNVSGVLPYEGDYMSGNMTVDVDDHTQVIWTEISKGFLVQKLKATGYDALWLNFGTVIDDEMLLNVTDLYIERGPDVAWSGVGWSFAMAEKNGTKWSTTYTHSFDIDFVPGTPAPLGEDVVTTKFDLAVEVADMSTFSVDSVVASIATSSGIDAEDVVVEEIVFEVKATYAFDSSVTVAQATKTVAIANNVLESQVTLTAVSRRRLDPSSAASSLRRLASQEYATVIKTTDTAQATSIMTSSADAAALTSALATVAPEAPAPTIEVAPAVEVTVKTALVSDSDVAVAAPTASTLNSELSSALNQTIEVEVENTVTESCSGGVCSESGSDSTLDDGSANGAFQLAPLLSVPCVGLVAALAAAL